MYNYVIYTYNAYAHICIHVYLYMYACMYAYMHIYVYIHPNINAILKYYEQNYYSELQCSMITNNTNLSNRLNTLTHV